MNVCSPYGAGLFKSTVKVLKCFGIQQQCYRVWETLQSHRPSREEDRSL